VGGVIVSDTCLPPTFFEVGERYGYGMPLLPFSSLGSPSLRHLLVTMR
jgi:hypothetical protein